MNSYLNHLESAYDQKTFERKLGYIRHNIFRFLPHQKSASILELGPGLGELVAFVNKEALGTIDIVDNDKTVLSYLKAKFNVRKAILVGNVAKVADKLSDYDAIVLIQVLEHMPPNTYKEVLRTLYVHLRPGGNIIIVVPNGGNPLGLVERYGDLQHYNCFTVRSLSDLVSLAELKSAQVTIKGYEIPPDSVLNWLRIGAQKLLHALLLFVMIVNGGTFFKTLTPNIMLVITKPTVLQ